MMDDLNHGEHGDGVCHLIAGAIEGGDTRINVLLSYAMDRPHFFRTLFEVLQEHGIPCRRYDGSRAVAGSGDIPVVVTTYLAGYAMGFEWPQYFPMWDARRDAEPAMIALDEYLRMHIDSPRGG